MGDEQQKVRAEARIGQVLRGRWKLDSLIGIGGMATVYAATHRNGRRGAVKILHPEMALYDEAKTRFLREGYLANKVEHPGAVRVLDDDTHDDGAVYLVMELLEGEALDRKILKGQNGRLDEREAVRITIGMLDTLEAAHKRDVVHRDLKPDNVFVTTKGAVKILDFGIARAREATQHAGTQAGMLLGTPTFMPPEQACGDWQKVDGRTDLWATGATLFAMLSGRTVHQGDTPQRVLFHAMSKPAPPLLSIAPHVSRGVAAIVDRALAFEREHRWPTAADMRAALRVCEADLSNQGPVSSGPIGTLRPTDSGNWARAPRTLSMPAAEELAPASQAEAKLQALAEMFDDGLEDRDTEVIKVKRPAAAVETPPASAPQEAPAPAPLTARSTLGQSAISTGLRTTGGRSSSLWIGVGAGVVLLVAIGLVLMKRGSAEPRPLATPGDERSAAAEASSSAEANTTASATAASAEATASAVATAAPPASDAVSSDAPSSAPSESAEASSASSLATSRPSTAAPSSTAPPAAPKPATSGSVPRPPPLAFPTPTPPPPAQPTAP